MSSAHSVSMLAQSGRRLHARRRMDGLVYVDLGPNNGALLIDLGEGGLSFQSVAPVSLDQAVLLKFKLPGGANHIEGYAEVAWLNESQKGGGLRFVELSANALGQIRGWTGVLPAAPETGEAVSGNGNGGGSNTAQESAKESSSADSHPVEESVSAELIETTVTSAEASENFTIGENAQPPGPETADALHSGAAVEEKIPAATDRAAQASAILEFLAEINAVAASPDPLATQLPSEPSEVPASPNPTIVADDGASGTSLQHDSQDDRIDRSSEIAMTADPIPPSSEIPPMAAGSEATVLLDRESQIKTEKPSAPASDVAARPAGVVRTPEFTPKNPNSIAAVAPAKPTRAPASHSKAVAPAQKRPRTPAPAKLEPPVPAVYRPDSAARGSFVRQTPKQAPATTEWESLPQSEPETNEAQWTLREALKSQALKIGIGAVAGACLVLVLVAAVPSLRTRVQATADARSGGFNLLNTPAFEVEVADLNNRRWILRSGGEAASPFSDTPSRGDTRSGGSNSSRDSAKSPKPKASDRSADAANATDVTGLEDAEETPEPKLPKPGVLALSRPLVKQSNTPSAQLLAPSIFDGITPPVGSFSDRLPASGPGVPGIVPPESPAVTRPSALQAAVLVQRVAPVYPPTALSAALQGDVTVNATIGKDGVPKNLKAVKGDLRLVPAAVAAISQWRYRPATLGGEPIDTEINITVSFKLQ